MTSCRVPTRIRLRSAAATARAASDSFSLVRSSGLSIDTRSWPDGDVLTPVDRARADPAVDPGRDIDAAGVRLALDQQRLRLDDVPDRQADDPHDDEGHEKGGGKRRAQRPICRLVFSTFCHQWRAPRVSMKFTPDGVGSALACIRPCSRIIAPADRYMSEPGGAEKRSPVRVHRLRRDQPLRFDAPQTHLDLSRTLLPAAGHAPSPYCARSAFLSNLPTLVLANASTNRIFCGTANFEITPFSL